jgi:acetoin utilization protein AcuB
MRLQDIMSTDIKTIEPDAALDEARNLMQQHRIHHLLVFAGGEVVGVVSARDLAQQTQVRGSRGVGAVAGVMSKDVVTAGPETTIRQAANLMRGRGIGCLAVVDRDRPVGILTTTDLLELIGRGVERPIERSTRWTLRRRGARDAGPSARHARRG